MATMTKSMIDATKMMKGKMVYFDKRFGVFKKKCKNLTYEQIEELEKLCQYYIENK